VTTRKCNSSPVRRIANSVVIQPLVEARLITQAWTTWRRLWIWWRSPCGAFPARGG
jgi:hypothetical protein